MKQAAHRPAASAPQSDHRPFFRRGGEGAFFVKGSAHAKSTDSGPVIQRMSKDELESELWIVPPDAETLLQLERMTNEWEKRGATAPERRIREGMVKELVYDLNLAVGATSEEPTGGWIAAVQQGLEAAEATFRKKMDAENRRHEGHKEAMRIAAAEETRRHLATRAARDLAAPHDPNIPEYVETGKGEDPEYKVSREAGMGDFKVLLLKDATYSISTDALSSCTGLAIYDPVSRVGALIHVYTAEDYPKISGAMIDAMRAEAVANGVGLGPSAGFQASMMPGALPGVNMSHMASILEELRKAGITHIRNLAEEGRLSSGFRLIGGGKITNK